MGEKGGGLLKEFGALALAAALALGGGAILAERHSQATYQSALEEILDKREADFRTLDEKLSQMAASESFRENPKLVREAEGKEVVTPLGEKALEDFAEGYGISAGNFEKWRKNKQAEGELSPRGLKGPGMGSGG